MEKTVTMNLRVNPTVKRQAEAVLKQIGIPMATAVDMYLRQISMKGGIPFPVTVSGAPAECSADAMSDAQLHAAIDEGLGELRDGKTRDAHAAFDDFRSAHR